MWLSCGADGVVQTGRVDHVRTPIAASPHSRGPVVGHSMARMVPFGSRSSVGA